MAITAVLQAASLSVDPGQSVAGDVTLRNEGSAEARLALSVSGPGRPYSWLTPDTVTLGAGAETTVRVGFNLPHASVPPAGPLAFAVTATIVGQSGPAVSAEGTVEVRPFSSLSATLSDSPVGDGADGSLRHEFGVGNRGNGPMPTALRAEADDADVSVRVEPESVVVTPGTKSTATVVVTPGKRPLTGKARTTAFRIVAQPEVGTPVTVQGHVHRKPVLAGRVVVAAAVVAVLALVAGGLALASGGDHAASPTATSRAGGAGSGIGATGGSKLDACPAKGHTDLYGVRGLTETEIA